MSASTTSHRATDAHRATGRPPSGPRMRVLEMCAGRGQGYAGQGLALADVLAHLYFRVMRRRADGSYLDRFVLSTGHSAIALFAILGEVGMYEQDELNTYGQPGSRIEESPLEGTPGFEITGGSLGQGLSQAVGMALGERLLGSGAQRLLPALGRRTGGGPGVGGGHVRQPLQTRQPDRAG